MNMRRSFLKLEQDLRNLRRYIYYNFLNESFDDFLKELKSIQEEKTAYIFSLDDVIDGELFKGVENIFLEPVPAKILMQYRKIMRKHLNILL